MEILNRIHCEMIHATFKNAKERQTKKEEMQNEGWIVFREYLNSDIEKVIVIFLRELKKG